MDIEGALFICERSSHHPKHFFCVINRMNDKSEIVDVVPQLQLQVEGSNLMYNTASGGVGGRVKLDLASMAKGFSLYTDGTVAKWDHRVFFNTFRQRLLGVVSG